MQQLSPAPQVVATLTRGPQAVAVHILKKFARDQCTDQAASLTFTTLLSLVPFLAVAFAALKGFGGFEAIQERVEELLYAHLVTGSSRQAAEYLQRLTEGINARAIGTVGFLAVIVTSVVLLNTVAGAFNRVWGVEERRSLKDRFLVFFTLTILGPLLFGASISITGLIRQSAPWAWVSLPGLGPLLGLMLPFLLTWVGFLLLYWVIPSVPLRLRPALVGSLITAVTWELAKIGFEVYVSRMASYERIYGTLSVIPVFLLWLYVSWLIALLGFEIIFFLQHPEARRGLADPAAIPPRAAVVTAMRAFLAVAEAFLRGGGPVPGRRVAERLLLPEGTATAILADLEGLGYLARTAGPEEAYLPRRAPAAVRVADLWRALGGSAEAPDGDPLGRLLAGAAQASRQAMGDVTVQDLIQAGAGPGGSGAAHAPRPDAAQPA